MFADLWPRGESLLQLRLPLVVVLLLTLLALPGWSAGSCCCTRRAQEATEVAANLPPCCAARLQRLRADQAEQAEPGIRSRCDCQIEPAIPAVDRQQRWDGSSLKRQIELFATVTSSVCCVRLERLTESHSGQIPDAVPIVVDLDRLCRSLT